MRRSEASTIQDPLPGEKTGPAEAAVTPRSSSADEYRPSRAVASD